MNEGVKSLLRVAAKGVFAAADVLRSDVPGPRILIYHQIDAGLGRQMEVTGEAFRAQVDWMLDNGAIVGLDEALTRRAVPDAAKLFVISFDDGYEDIYREAWPLLRDRRIPFVLYLTTAPVETRIPLTPGGNAEPLTWDQIEEMLESCLLTLGAHTHRHRDVRLLDESEIEDEISASNDLIAQRTGTEPQHFAYPWGYWSKAADRVVRGAYATAVLGSGRAIDGDADPYLLNRVPVQLSDTSVFFRRKMTTGMRLEDIVRRRVAGYRGP